MVIGKDDILKAEDLAYQEVDVPEWGGSVRLRSLTGEERDAFESEVYSVDNNNRIVLKRDNYMAKLLAKCIVDDSGKRLFSDKEVRELGAKNAGVLKRLFAAAQDLNGMSREVQDEIEKK